MTTDASIAKRSWRPRLTIRARLTTVYTALIAVAGIVMVVVVSVFMRTVPTYVLPEGLKDLDGGSRGSASDVLSKGATEPAAIDTASTTVAISLGSPSDILNTVLVVSIIALAVLVLLGGVLAWIIAGRVLKPLQTINAAAKLAGDGSLDHRVGASGPRDEVRDLSDTFDDMLERLDDAFRSHQRFAANASHELRTPLATTQTVLEVALADPNASTDELRAAATKVLETNRRNIETVAALLDLAEIGRRALHPETIVLGRMIDEVVREHAAEAMARDLRIRVDVPGNIVVAGDTVLVRQAVGNLVINAVRHNYVGGSIGIRARRRSETVLLVVENSGAIIPPVRVRELAEPFVRGAGRTTTGEAAGHGLGLAIVASVARAHNGTLQLEARPRGGLVARLDLPVAGAAQT